MFAVLLFGLVATVAAAPQFQPPRLAEDFFDARQFLAQLTDEMREIDDMLASFNKRSLSQPGNSGVVGNEYIINIHLTGFEKQDIAVTGNNGFIIVQLVHKINGDSKIKYKTTINLPRNVDGPGSWTFNQGVLKIVIPLKTGAVKTTEATKVDVTEMPVYKNREEMDNKSEEIDTDVDVGLRGDLDKTELEFNEIPRNRVEVTTSAVDLKGDVEIVPVHSGYHFEIRQ